MSRVSSLRIALSKYLYLYVTYIYRRRDNYMIGEGTSRPIGRLSAVVELAISNIAHTNRYAFVARERTDRPMRLLSAESVVGLVIRTTAWCAEVVSVSAGLLRV